MFSKIKSNIFTTPVKSDFISSEVKISSITRSGNGAVKYDSSGNHFVDQFNNLGLYKEQRSYDEIASDAHKLWSIDPNLALRFTFYLRIITRKVRLWDGEELPTVSRGGGLKHESIMRMIWLSQNHPKVFWDNLPLFVCVGSWRDIFEMMRYDLMYHGWANKVLDFGKLAEFIILGLGNEQTSDLVKKYIPHISARSDCKTVEKQANTIIGKFLASRLKLTYEQYRKMKATGTAHSWQQHISRRQFDKINFSAIHGRALALLVNGEFLANNNLEARYMSWLEKQPVVKFTGYPYELTKNINYTLPAHKKITINRQFTGLVNKAKEDAITNSGLIVVRDTSASMGSPAIGNGISSNHIAKSMALYFSYFLSGYFADAWIEFNKSAKLHKWIGDSPVDRFLNEHSGCVGNTNFLSVIKLFVSIKNSGVTEDQFPNGILCISDGEFDPAQLGKTNVEVARKMLHNCGFSKKFVDDFKIILWNIPNRFYGSDQKPKFETYGDVKNVYYISGYDGASLSFLTGTKTKEDNVKDIPQTPEELFKAAMSQDVLELLVL